MRVAPSHQNFCIKAVKCDWWPRAKVDRHFRCSSSYVILCHLVLLHNFCSDSSRSGPDDFQETSICFLRHFQIIRFVIAWWGRAGSDFLWLTADKTGAQHSQCSTEPRLWHLVVSQNFNEKLFSYVCRLLSPTQGRQTGTKFWIINQMPSAVRCYHVTRLSRYY